MHPPWIATSNFSISLFSNGALKDTRKVDVVTLSIVRFCGSEGQNNAMLKRGMKTGRLLTGRHCKALKKFRETTFVAGQAGHRVHLIAGASSEALKCAI